MTIRELANVTAELAEQVDDETPVVLPTLGGFSHEYTDVDGLRIGMDWLDGKITVFCRKPVVSFEHFKHMQTLTKKKRGWLTEEDSS